MKYAPHTSKEHVPNTNQTIGNRRRLIPETDTEKALLASVLRQAESHHRGEHAVHSTHFGGDPATDLLPDSPDEVDAGWYGYQYTVAPADFTSWMDLSSHHTVWGYSCVVEHPHRDGEKPGAKRLEVWHHIPEQEGCQGVSGTSHFPVSPLIFKEEAIEESD